jgi:hypothetical protein
MAGRQILRTVRLETGQDYPHRRITSSLRFGPMRRGRLIASLWRIWTQGDEVYIANRNESNCLRASLHSSGKWFFHHGQRRTDLVAPWTMPGGDWLHALELAFLIADGTAPMRERRAVKSAKPALAIETPTDHKLALNILLGTRRDSVHEAPLPDIMNGPILFRSRLTSGVPVVVVGRVVPFSEQDREVLHYHQVTLGVRVNVSGTESIEDPQGELLRLTPTPQGNILTVFALSPTAFHSDATGS